MTSRSPLVMKIDLTVIEDLGIKLYGKLPPVISEIVANAWDADANNVEITISEGDIDSSSKITIQDNGTGMSYDEIAEKYLRIGRKRRDEDGTDLTRSGRKVMGRKGIGKLSVFGVAKSVEIATVNNGKRNRFLMNIDDMLNCARKDGEYRPQEVETDVDTEEPEGMVVILTDLKRTSKISPVTIKRDLSKHFTVIDDSNFIVTVNGTSITHADKLSDSDIEKEWIVHNESVDDENGDWAVSGKIWAIKTPLNGKDVGMSIMARGKMVQKPTMFEMKPGIKHTYSYITGEITAEFVDTDEDLVSTNRQSIIWDNHKGEALRNWGTKKLRWVSEELQNMRREVREREIRETPEFKEWIDGLEPSEKKIADKIINIVTSQNTLDSERRIEIMQYVKDSFEQKAFTELVAALPESPDSVTILEVFKTWDVIEAREMTRIVKGRLDAIERLGNLIDENAREVPDIHDYFKKWPWVLDPTWTKWQHEVRFSQLLAENYPEDRLDESDRRIDFVAIGVGDTVIVIELKRPRYKIGPGDLDQLTRYTEFIKNNVLGNDATRKYRDVAGYLLVGKIPSDDLVKARMREMEPHRRYVKTYEELISAARILHSEFQKKLDDFDESRRRQKQ